ncbi:MAG TPA: alpha/beta hydrolase [Candidatus Baltobacteraceae bacterium]|nr:alpha/beta hydrolase [Candidatus Baltobacteraceae bacterium]
MKKTILYFLAGLTLIAMSSIINAQQQPQKERTLDEIKSEAIKRAENGMYPLIGLDPADVREAFSHINTTDNDEWAAAFSAVADRYMTEGNSLLASNPAQADKNFVRAWRLYSFARWPVPASAGKKRAYAKALEAFLAHAKMMDPPLEVVRIPFENSEIVGYLRLPKNAKGPVPMVIAISGLDSRKEDLTENFGVVLGSGIGYIGVDSPGTGQAPIKASETADRMFSKVIDYLQTRPEVDKSRIGVDGQSFGAYWATKLAIVERARLKAVVAQSPPVDATFEKNFVLQKTLGNREYLFGLGPALMSIFEGANKVEDLGEILPKLSLVNQHLLGKPTTSMLIIAGAQDTQVPISDAYLLLSSGDVPKEAWINPQGGHLGRQVKIWPDPVIFRKILVPWLVRNLEVPPM